MQFEETNNNGYSWIIERKLNDKSPATMSVSIPNINSLALSLSLLNTVIIFLFFFSYCHEFYEEEWNRKGSCAFAPDYLKSGIDTISGMMCARCMLYHCMSDSEGDLVNHPCSCDTDEDINCTKKWVGLAILSLLIPCLWCYPPMKACHMIGLHCGVCGGKHRPQIWQPIQTCHQNYYQARNNEKSKQQVRVHFGRNPNLYERRNFYQSAFNNYQHLHSSAIKTQPLPNSCNFF